MKLLFFTSVAIFSLLACQNKEKNYHEQWNKDFETALSEAQNSVASEDTIFLNFRFGMTEKDVRNHFNSLLKEKKVYLKNEKFTYDFHASNETLKTTFVPEYFNDKLYRFTLLFNDDVLGGAICMFKALDTFKEKAKSDGYTMYIYENILGKTEYYFIKKNIVIEFTNTGSTTGSTGMMIYTNQPVIELINQYKKEKEKSTINDF